MCPQRKSFKKNWMYVLISEETNIHMYGQGKKISMPWKKEIKRYNKMEKMKRKKKRKKESFVTKGSPGQRSSSGF